MSETNQITTEEIIDAIRYKLHLYTDHELKSDSFLPPATMVVHEAISKLQNDLKDLNDSVNEKLTKVTNNDENPNKNNIYVYVDNTKAEIEKNYDSKIETLEKAIQLNTDNAEDYKHDLSEQIKTERERLDTFLSASDIGNEAIDTLKEIQDWINADETGTDVLIKRINTLEDSVEQELADRSAADEAHTKVIQQEVSARKAADSALATDVKNIQDNIENCLHFIGIFDSLPADTKEVIPNYGNIIETQDAYIPGDVCIVLNNNSSIGYIYLKEDTWEHGQWKELGNTKDYVTCADYFDFTSEYYQFITNYSTTLLTQEQLDSNQNTRLSVLEGLLSGAAGGNIGDVLTTIKDSADQGIADAKAAQDTIDTFIKDIYEVFVSNQEQRDTDQESRLTTIETDISTTVGNIYTAISNVQLSAGDGISKAEAAQSNVNALTTRVETLEQPILRIYCGTSDC